MKLRVYLGPYLGVLIYAAGAALFGHATKMNVPDVMAGITMVLIIDKCFENPFWKRA